MHSFNVANVGSRTIITGDLRLEAAHFTLPSDPSRINQRRLKEVPDHAAPGVESQCLY
jgi:hypothetical protein